jgi:hypothetical protein
VLLLLNFLVVCSSWYARVGAVSGGAVVAAGASPLTCGLLLASCAAFQSVSHGLHKWIWVPLPDGGLLLGDGWNGW